MGHSSKLLEMGINKLSESKVHCHLIWNKLEHFLQNRGVLLNFKAESVCKAGVRQVWVTRSQEIDFWPWPFLTTFK